MTDKETNPVTAAIKLVEVTSEPGVVYSANALAMINLNLCRLIRVLEERNQLIKIRKPSQD